MLTWKIYKAHGSIDELQMTIDLCRGHMEHVLTSGYTKVNARLTRDTIVVNCAPAEHAHVTGSGNCDHQKED